tara:strand:- start:372 stop:881 length:510 start_codon:yes stop_codon:yes gene_type:complete
MARTLVDICMDMESLDAILSEADGDISDPLVESTIYQWFEELDCQMEEKVDRYCKLIRERELRAEARTAEADRIRALAKADANGARGMKDRLLLVLERRGTRTYQTPSFKVSIAKNGGKLPLTIRGEVPAGYQRVEVCPDTDMIRLALEDGKELEFAVLEERGKHLRVR